MIPCGLGVYLASGDLARPPADVARRVADAGCSHAYLWIEAPDGAPRRPSLDRLARLSEALHRERIDRYLWSFPRASRAAQVGPWAGECLRVTGAWGVVLDVERPPMLDGKRIDRDWTAADATALVGGTIDALTESHTLGVTSYPGRAGHHLPWSALAVGWGSPQVYGTADYPARARAAVEAWRAAHGEVVPITSARSPAAPGKTISPEQLRRRLDAVARDAAGALAVQAAAVWALGLLTAQHRRACREWAESAGW